MSFLTCNEKTLLRRYIRFYINHHSKTDNKKYELLYFKLNDIEIPDIGKDRRILEKINLPTSRSIYGLTVPKQRGRVLNTKNLEDTERPHLEGVDTEVP